MSKRTKFLCLDCKVDTGKIGEFYMLKDSVWFSVVKSNQGMLCIKCIENRLGRKLTSNDFNQSYVNRVNSCWSKSNQLMNRLGL